MAPWRKIRTIFVGLVFLFPLSSYAELVSIYPKEPVWGEDIIITYNPKDKGAMFSLSDEVYVVRWLYFADSLKTVWGKMEAVDGVFRYTFPVPSELSYVVCEFVTPQGWDEQARVQVMIYRSEGVPARGAYQRCYLILLSWFKSYLSKEWELYPDNYAAYRDKWWLSEIMSPEDYKDIVESDMKQLPSPEDTVRPDLMYSFSYGYLLLGEEEKSRAIVNKLLRDFPESWYAKDALRSYWYKGSELNVGEEAKGEIRANLMQSIREHPNTFLAREFVDWFVDNDSLPLESIEAVCRQWFQQEPDNPKIYKILASAYQGRGVKEDSVVTLLSRAIELVKEGYLRFYGEVADVSNSSTLSRWCKEAADFFFERKDYKTALRYINEADSATNQTEKEIPFSRALILQSMGEDSLAYRSYRLAWFFGSEEAYDSLQAAYEREHGDLDGFDTFLTSDIDKSYREPVEDFTFTPLEGDKIRFSSLRGKVVVINLWSPGCVPCVAEMPALNRLVENFEGEDIIFLAPSTYGSKKSLKKFLEKHPFKYTVTLFSKEIHERFWEDAVPLHAIIDREGRLAYRSTGGSENTDKYLKPVIEHLLSE